MEGFDQSGQFQCRDGVAKTRGMKNLCKQKVCFVGSDLPFIEETLLSIARDNDCYQVKYSTVSRAGSYLGICYFTNEQAVGDMWARYESHPKCWVTIHDDAFCESYKSKIRTY